MKPTGRPGLASISSTNQWSIEQIELWAYSGLKRAALVFVPKEAGETKLLANMQQYTMHGVGSSGRADVWRLAQLRV